MIVAVIKIVRVGMAGDDSLAKPVSVASDKVQQFENAHFALHFPLIAAAVDEIVQRLSSTRTRLFLCRRQDPVLLTAEGGALIASLHLLEATAAVTVLVVNQLN